MAASRENADRRLELINGVIIVMPPSSKINAILASWIATLPNMFVVPNQLGYVTGPDGGYDPGPHDTAVSDAAFIATARAAGVTGKTLSGAPDLAVEVISPSETPRSVLDKVHRHLRAGGQLVWDVYPEARVIDVYRPAEGGSYVQTVGIDGELNGDPALPGLRLKVRDVFARLD
ncbi:MAG: Uma2 family endonuclease [Anaerolineae bacterium]|nr:Uma2 family endonuclease [Anaerolineae bacterium]